MLGTTLIKLRPDNPEEFFFVKLGRAKKKPHLSPLKRFTTQKPQVAGEQNQKRCKLFCFGPILRLLHSKKIPA